MKYYLRIDSYTLPLLTNLNGGVTPEIEKPTTYFVYDSDPEGRNNIISSRDYWALRNDNTQRELILTTPFTD